MKKNLLNQEFFDRNIPAPSENFAWDTMAKLRMAAAKEELGGRPRRKLSAAMVMTLVVVLLAATALAVTLLFSAQYDATRTARQAVMDKYGLTQDTLGLFGASETQEGDTWTVRFTPIMYDGEAMGSYDVTVKGGKASEVSWSNDGKAVPTFQEAGFTGEAWGQSQLVELLAMYRSHQAAQSNIDWNHGAELTLEDFAERDKALAEASQQGLEVGVMHMVPTENDIQPEEAVELAKKAVAEKYGVFIDLLADLEVQIDFLKYSDDEEPVYRISMGSGEQRPGEYIFHVDYYVALFSPSGTVQRCTAGSPTALTLPEGSLKDYRDAVVEFMEEGKFEQLTPEEKAALAKRIVEAGHGDLIGNKAYVAPAIGDIPQEEAMGKAEAAMVGTYGFTQDTLTLFKADPSMQMLDGERAWVIDYSPQTQLGWWSSESDMEMALGNYQVTLKADMGDAQTITWDLREKRGTQTYTGETWGQAEVYDAKMLPWVQALIKANELYYEEQEGWVQEKTLSLEEEAHRDQMFRDAGFPATRYPSGLPREGDLTQENAFALAKQALCEEFGLTEERLTKAEVILHYLVARDTKGPEWTFMFFFGGQEDYDYYVSMDAESGAILSVMQEGMGNG